MSFIDIFAGYTIDLLSGLILFLFFNNEKLSFNQYMEKNKKKVRNLSYFFIVIILGTLFFFLK